MLILHTVIRENIPKDPHWFYIQPVHCSFHTNGSMSHLMNEWGYTRSIYCPTSKCWILFKQRSYNTHEKLTNFVNHTNSLLQDNYLYYKYGFVDYWID